MLAARPPDSPPTSHQPTGAYTSGLPAPPRILIPPPSLGSSGGYDVSGSSSSSGGGGGDYGASSCDFGPLEWQQPSLSHMVLQAEEAVLPGTLQDWKYEYRREAQQLLPHLFLGPLSAARDADFLRQHDITLLLAVRSSMMTSARASRLLAAHQLAGVRYETIDVASPTQLISEFARAQDIIDRHYVAGLLPSEAAELAASSRLPLDGRTLYVRQQRWMAARARAAGTGGSGSGSGSSSSSSSSCRVPGGRTLLFCESGNERSAAVAAAYIMQHLGGTTIQAIQLVQGKRFCVCFDDATKWMLTNYEPIWKARSQISHHLLDDGGGGGGGGAWYGADGGPAGGAAAGGAVGGGAVGTAGGVGAYSGQRRTKRRIEDYEDDDDVGEGPDGSGGGGRAPFSDSPVETEPVDVEMA